MCYVCGCGLPHDDMGVKGNLTEEMWQHLAKENNVSVEDAKRNALAMLKKDLGDK